MGRTRKGVWWMTKGIRGEGGKSSGRQGGRQGGVEYTQEQLRQARVDLAGAAGVGYNRVSLEALYLLPLGFTEAYVRLFDKSFRGSGNMEKRNPDEQVATGRGKVKAGDLNVHRHGGGKARVGGRRYKEWWTIQDEAGFRLKGRIDRELQGLANEITESLARLTTEERNLRDGDDMGSEVRGRVTCVGERCRRILKVGWKFCPWCGVGVE